MTNSAWRTTAPTVEPVVPRAPRAAEDSDRVSRVQPGMARGRIFDEETGHGVGGVLVRLGSEAAVTDAQGRVAFASLAAGTLPRERGCASDRASPTRCSPATSPSTCRPRRDGRSTSRCRWSAADRCASTCGNSTSQRRSRTPSPDSLVDAGGFADAMIALIGARDTIYQITNQDGVADFRDVPRGGGRCRWSRIAAGGARAGQ